MSGQHRVARWLRPKAWVRATVRRRPAVRFGASCLGQPEVALGLIAGAGGTVRWPAAVGGGRALGVLLTACQRRGPGALRHRLARSTRELAELAAVGVVAQRIAAMPTGAVTAIKRVLDAPRDALVVESNAVADLLATGDHRERMERFLAAGGQTREAATWPMVSIIDHTRTALPRLTRVGRKG